MQMGFGKYRSQEVRWVVENDRAYIRWVLIHTAGSEAVRTEAGRILNEDRDCPYCGHTMTRIVWGLPVGSWPPGVELAGCAEPLWPAVWRCRPCARGFQEDLSEGELPFDPYRSEPRSGPPSWLERAVSRTTSAVKRLLGAT